MFFNNKMIKYFLPTVLHILIVIFIKIFQNGKKINLFRKVSLDDLYLVFNFLCYISLIIKQKVTMGIPRKM